MGESAARAIDWVKARRIARKALDQVGDEPKGDGFGFCVVVEGELITAAEALDINHVLTLWGKAYVTVAPGDFRLRA